MRIFEAIVTNQYEQLARYLQRGGNPNLSDTGGSPMLHLAVAYSGLRFVDLLLRKGASVHQLDAFGNTALHIACLAGGRDAAELLLSHGAHIDSVSVERPWTPLMIALNQHDIEMASWLIQQGADPNFVDHQEGWTPLLVACDQGLRELSLQLIEQGGQVDATIQHGDAQGKSAIHLVSYHGNVELARSLMQKGVDIDQQPIGGGLSPLHWAVYNGHEEYFSFLLEEGADTNNPAPGIYQGRTPLHYAIAFRHEEMVARLLKSGADPLVADHEGDSPLDLAWILFNDESDPLYSRMISLMEAFI